jgi:two-component system, NtrC family, nitrogen regulation sensor histidine kinase NtrY
MSQNHKYRLYLYLFLLLISIAGMVFFPFWKQHEQSEKSIHKSVQDLVWEKESLVSETVEEIIFRLFAEGPRKDDAKNLSDFWTQNIFGSKTAANNNEGESIFLFHKDSLIFWNSNQIPDMETLFSISDAQPVMQKRSNGWYLFLAKQYDDILVVAASLIKHEYPFQNQYLQNQFSGCEAIPSSVVLTENRGGDEIFSTEGVYLCSLQMPIKIQEEQKEGWLIVFLISAYLFLMLFLYELSFKKNPVTGNSRWHPRMVIGIVWIVRIIQYWIGWPETLMNTALFAAGPDNHFWLNDSIGDFVINGFLILVSALLIYFTHKQKGSERPVKPVATGWMVLRMVLAMVLLGLLMTAIHFLVRQHSVFVDLEFVNQFTWMMIPSLLGLGFWLLGMVLLLLCLANLAPSFSRFVLVLVLVTLCATVVLHDANKTKEQAFRETMAQQIMQRENPEIEAQLDQLAQQMHHDQRLHAWMHLVLSSTDPVPLEDSAINHIRHQYFNQQWNNFNLQITLCTPGKELIIQPQNYLMPCDAYFSEIKSVYGATTPYESVTFLDYGYGNEDYLLVLTDSTANWNIYIELSSRAFSQGTGYPELLVDRSSYHVPNLSSYSIAFYAQNKLVHRIGSFHFGMDLHALMDSTSYNEKDLKDGMDHQFFDISPDVVMVVSLPESTWLNMVAAYSYLLLYLMVLAGLGYGIIHIRSLFSWRTITLRSKLQGAMLGLILVSFIVLGIVMVVNLVSINNQKNREYLLERTLSILVEMEHKLDYVDHLDQAQSEEVEALLVKFSNVFFSDINLYRPDGKLFATSRPRIFQEGMISDCINPTAMALLKEQETGMFVQTEAIGTLEYLSAYIPFYNSRDQLLGFLNLPYFSRQDDLRREISSFLVAFINIYVLFILFGLISVYFLANYITSPLKLLASRLGETRFGKTDNKLSWKHEDEIGRLVKEYNRMLDELAVSAEKLAVSERESAWREMAQQVAHEIKNPLTPMKLSVQHLLHTWKDKQEDWDERFIRFTEALIAQIETLNRIASEFSYFAKMPKPENRVLNLDELVDKTMAIYQDLSGIRFERLGDDGEPWIYADRNQILRVLGNVVNNAIQALEDNPEGVIKVKVEKGEEVHRVLVEDNGKGIQPPEATKIFQPRFTTRSGGTGLGLAIVKEILLSIGGEITFTSDPGVKTVFIIQLPACDPKQKTE